MRFAGFDLDHTLLEGDSDTLWMQHLAATSHPSIDLAEIDRFLADHAAGTLDAAAYYRTTLAPYVDTDFEDHADALERFHIDTLHPRLRPDVVARVAAERDAGALVVLVTATNELVARPLAWALGMDGCIATRIGRERGRLTGAVAGEASLGAGKTARVEAWLARRGTSLDALEDSAFYGDSINDGHIMQRVRRPVAVGPEARLAALAAERGWEVLTPAPLTTLR